MQRAWGGHQLCSPHLSIAEIKLPAGNRYIHKKNPILNSPRPELVAGADIYKIREG